WEVLSGKQVQLVHTNRPSDFVAFVAGGRALLGARVGTPPEFLDAIFDKRLATLPATAAQTQVAAVAPDGDTLATSSRDGSILVWKMSAFLLPKPQPVPPTAQQLPALWAELAKNGSPSYRAFWTLAGGDKETVAFLAAKLSPTKGPD